MVFAVSGFKKLIFLVLCLCFGSIEVIPQSSYSLSLTRNIDTRLVQASHHLRAPLAEADLQRDESKRVLAKKGAIGNGMPLNMERSKFYQKIRETIVDDHLYEPASQIVAEAVAKKLLKYQNELEQELEKNKEDDVLLKKRFDALKLVTDRYIDARNDNNYKNTLAFFEASEWISSSEDYLLGFHHVVNETHVLGFSADFILYLKGLEGHKFKFSDQEGELFEIVFSHDMVLTLIAEYLFHELHGEENVAHHMLYQNVQRQLFGELFGEHNLIKFFARKFIDKSAAVYQLRKFKESFPNGVQALNLNEFVQIFTSLKKHEYEMKRGIIYFSEEIELLDSLKSWSNVELVDSVSPQNIWDYLNNELVIDNNSFEAVQYLMCEMIHRIQRSPKGWPEQGPLSRERIVASVSKFLYGDLLAETEENQEKEAHLEKSKRWWRTVTAVYLRLMTAEIFIMVPVDLSKLRGAYLKGIDLSLIIPLGMELDLREADLREANFANLDLRDLDLGKTDLSGADLSGAILKRSQIMRQEIDLSKVFMDPENPLKIIEDDPLYIERLKRELKAAL